jgi:hypothetical protein
MKLAVEGIKLVELVQFVAESKRGSKKLQKTFTLKLTYISELGLKVKKTSKKGCIKFAKAEKGATFALAITK